MLDFFYDWDGELGHDSRNRCECGSLWKRLELERQRPSSDSIIRPDVAGLVRCWVARKGTSNWRVMKIKLLLAAVCCAALSGAYAQSPSPTDTADTGASPSATTSKETKTKRSKKRTQKTGTEDVTGSTGPSTGGVPQTNSTHGSSTIGTGTQATVGATSNTNPNASTGNMNPQGSATGQGNTKESHKGTSRDVTGSGGPSTGGVPQTNSTYGSRTTGTGTQATVGDTSNTNPNASTGNMNPQGSATGQSSTHRRSKTKKQKAENEASPAESPATSPSP